METPKHARSWWETFPGVLTALAGVIAAVGGLVTVLHQAGVLGGGSAPPASAVVEQGGGPAGPGSGPASGPISEPANSDHSPSATPASLPEAPAATASVAAPPSAPAARQATVYLTYSGDAYGCFLPLQVRIGSRWVTPQGSPFAASGLDPGPQPYEITGQILCPNVGSCVASGSGTLDVREGKRYGFVWQNTAVGLCSVVLVEE